MVAWECPTKPREASGIDPEAVHWYRSQSAVDPSCFSSRSLRLLTANPSLPPCGLRFLRNSNHHER
ncbi:hypothetical protein E6P09_11695 [Haloferax mediterranei ATCC 33500]|uniref:Uncharacterized protein n=1 Tax=Haloferax mediterranei (strain ATCC 33500 / DSM 1411 / JCM 8866 / NBRC 14739 / NCIMB 2177 / R-4) TaxID=523841 RepID=I3R5D0_HALMT|nr:hypothetical protein HFX_1734 [Haloferax mediterranei ATCC 33500]QCQ75900.1 hypothetical protein E6P09_11695 [Haloferax mediterranei ATCC 33500]